MKGKGYEGGPYRIGDSGGKDTIVASDCRISKTTRTSSTRKEGVLLKGLGIDEGHICLKTENWVPGKV